MVTLEFGLADEDSGPVLDGELPTSLNKTVRSHSLLLSEPKVYTCGSSGVMFTAPVTAAVPATVITLIK